MSKFFRGGGPLTVSNLENKKNENWTKIWKVSGYSGQYLLVVYKIDNIFDSLTIDHDSTNIRNQIRVIIFLILAAVFI